MRIPFHGKKPKSGKIGPSTDVRQINTLTLVLQQWG